MCLAIPGQISKIWGTDLEMRATVCFETVYKEVSLAFTPNAKVGDFVLIHVGYAISVLTNSEASDILRSIDQLGDEAEL